MNIAILTMFNGLSKTYSLVTVVEEQLQILLSSGHHVSLLVCQDCPDTERYGIYLDERIEWIKVTNRYNGEQIHWRDYSGSTGDVHPTFFEEAAVIAKDLAGILSNTDVCIMHDILYQGWHLIHNVAIREAQSLLPNVRFVAFTHSLPVQRPDLIEWPFSARFSPMPNTTFVYPTRSGLDALAAQYDVTREHCSVVNNSLNLLENADSNILSLSEQVDLLSPDILIVYPGRLTTGKQFEKAAALAGAIRSVSGLSLRMICCDFPSLDIHAHIYKSIIKEEGMKHGLQENDLVFTSDLGWKDGFPHRAVMDLFRYSNLFICPSYSESFGLIVLEAASGGNFLVLNQAVPALEELGTRLKAYFMRWNARNIGYSTVEHYSPSETDYYREHAVRIVELIQANQVLQAKTIIRQQYSSHWIWKHQLEPILTGHSGVN